MSKSIDPDETAHMSRLIWIYAVCKNLLLSPVAMKELTHNIYVLVTKPTKRPLRPAKTQFSPSSLIRVFAVRKLWFLATTERTASTLIRLGGCLG